MRVFLHGFTGAPESFDPLRAQLPGPVLLPTLLGHGRPAQEGGDRWEAEIDRLAAWVERAGARGSDLVGYSLGARVGAGLLVRHPGLFRRAVLVAPNLGLDDADRPARRRWEADLQHTLRHDGLEAFVAAWEALPLWATQQRLPAPTRAEQRATRRQHTADGLAHSLQVLGLGQMPDLRRPFAQLSTPVRVVVGADDAKFLALSEAVAPLPHVERVVVEGAGHNVVLEAPERLAEVVRWL